MAKTRQLISSEYLINVESILCDLFESFRDGVVFDIIVFNPPYVPTDQDEFDRAIRERDIAASWAGGMDGREVTDNFLNNVSHFLSRNGIAYMVALEANKIKEIGQIAEGYGLEVCEILKRREGLEMLYILRFRKRIACDL